MRTASVVIAFAAGGVLGATLAFRVRDITRLCAKVIGYRSVVTQNDSSQAPEDSRGIATTVTDGPLLDDEILEEQFTRNIQFFGREAQSKIMGSFVVVIGLGGVGSHAANFLLRSGVGKLRIVDFDQVTLSSLNRHAVAVRADVGISKALCMKQHLARVFPEATVEAVNALYEAEREEELLAGQPDFVIDAIDNIDTKVHLLAACHRRNIPVLCSGGAGGKADPSKVRVGDLAESVADPLCRAVRTQLRKNHNITRGIPVLMSTEKQRCDLVWSGDGDDMSNYQVVPNFRVRTIPVLGPIPAVFGMACAAYVLTQLAEQPFHSDPIIPLKMDQYETLYHRLVSRAEDKWGVSQVHVDQEDVVYIVKELYGGRSARSEPRPGKGLHRTTHDLELTLWDASRPAEVDNLVLLTRDEADIHDAMSLAELETSEPVFFAHVERALRKSRRENGFPGDHRW